MARSYKMGAAVNVTGTLELLIMGAKVELQEEGLTKLWDRMEQC